MAEESKAAEGQGQAQQAQAGQFPTDYSNLSTVYTNFCRVSVTPEELVLDFGLNTQMVPTTVEPVKLTHRVVMNFFTAKRLLGALNAVIHQHEKAYGALELDYQKRARSAAPGSTGIRPGQPGGFG
jgi:hypothetical protein